MQQVQVHPHDLLDAAFLGCVFPNGLSQQSSERLLGFLRQDAEAPLSPGEQAKKSIRDMLRWGGFKPAGRSKPASEYLLKAADGGFLGAINKAVDVCNVVSLHSGIPVSVVDLDRVRGPLSLQVAPAGSSYVFNASEQVIDLGGLLCLFDESGPCANAVKDSQRTKTDASSKRCLYVFWGTREMPGRTAAASQWARELLVSEGAEEVQIASGA